MSSVFSSIIMIQNSPEIKVQSWKLQQEKKTKHTTLKMFSFIPVKCSQDFHYRYASWSPVISWSDRHTSAEHQKCACTHTPQWASEPLLPPHSSIGPSGGRETHEMIPDMSDHTAAPVELSDINTFLPDCGQVRQGDLQWFPLAIALLVSPVLT